jgi:hypothetical protein
LDTSTEINIETGAYGFSEKVDFFMGGQRSCKKDEIQEKPGWNFEIPSFCSSLEPRAIITWEGISQLPDGGGAHRRFSTTKEACFEEQALLQKVHQDAVLCMRDACCKWSFGVHGESPAHALAT